jgi:hypothetical protein
VTQPSEGFKSNPDASGVDLAYLTVGGFKIPIVVLADESGHLIQTVPSYTFFIKAQAGAANKDHFDIFNAAASGKILEVRGLWVSPSLIATVTGTVSPDFDFYRTSAVGTGGTSMPYKATTFPNLSPADTNNAALPPQVTARAAPTGGATIAEALFASYITQEEGQAGSQLVQWQNLLPVSAVTQRYTAREGQGFKLRQITAGVAQNFSFFGLITLV